MPEVSIGGRQVGSHHAPYVIAEAGINHNGDLAQALQMVRVARDAGADAIKFQTFRADEFIADAGLMETYCSQGREVTESALAMFRRCELSREAWFRLKAECDALGMTFLSTPQNQSDLDLLLEVGITAIKIGSDDVTNFPLVTKFAGAGLPLILSCGMADLQEVRRSLEVAGALNGHPTVVMLCTSQYPTPPADVNLRKLATLRAEFPSVVLGFSDHTRGPLASALAVSFGAAVFEKHFTLSHDLAGPDHWFSEDPAGLSAWVDAIRAAHVMLGEAIVQPTPTEREIRPLTRRGIVALRFIARGEKFTEANIGVRRPGTGLPPEFLEAVVGKVAGRAIEPGEAVMWADAGLPRRDP